MEDFEHWQFPVDSKNTKVLLQDPSTSTDNKEKSLPSVPKEYPSFLKDFPQWTTARTRVNENLNNIKCWEELMKCTENFLMIKPLNDNFKKVIHSTFNELLTRFPLFFGYWKKFVSIEFQLNGLDASISILSRSLDSFPNSIELWIDYASILITNNNLNDEESVEKLRAVFRRGITKVGWQFLSHPFWDKYISFETNLKLNNGTYDKNCRLYKIYSQVIKIPLHQYSRYLTEFNELRKNFTSDQLLEIDEELKIAIKESTKDKRTAINEYFASIFSITSQGVAARWKYESKFKPNYFNLVPLQHASLEIFQQYLKFEELNGTKQQIITLYERVLVPAAFYEKFWIMYIRWLTTNHADDKEKINEVYNRAINIFLPLSKNHVRFSYLFYLEKIGEYDELNSTFLIFINFFSQSPELKSAIFTKFLNFLRRSMSYEDYINDMNIVLKKYFKGNFPSSTSNTEETKSSNFKKLTYILDDSLVCVMINSYINSLWLFNNKHYNKSQVLGIFVELSIKELLRSNEEFWVNYFNFTKAIQNYGAMKKMIHLLRTTGRLSPQFINDLSNLYIDYFQSNIKKIALDVKLPSTMEVHKEIFEMKQDIQSPIAFQKSHKLRISSTEGNKSTTTDQFDKVLHRSNGNIGFEVDERPLVSNQLPIYENLIDTPNLPTFKNVEKASLIANQIGS
ncbi:Prp39 protein [Saccharomycopsis crataegensis]|uniref:Prp39 protein n=1 Tax=Saccharomycopsis crataegensis TaxID=43959 RepID=A0AAV5QR91_9ASCO|nr:Prp39 protein [Saccharomycopsis crataegensis]